VFRSWERGPGSRAKGRRDIGLWGGDGARPASHEATRSGADSGRERVVVAVQAGAKVVDFGEVERLTGFTGDRID